MNQAEVTARLKAIYENLPRQERLAARFILEHPREVAVMSMREQSRLAGVPPSTMTRLAKRINLSGYDALREAFIDTIRAKGNIYESRVPGLIAKNQQGEGSLLRDLIASAVSNTESLYQQEIFESITRASKLLNDARTIYCLGTRSSFSVAFYFHHVTSWFTNNVQLIDGAGETGIMSLMHNLGPKDVLLAASLKPYARRTVTLCRHLAQKKIRIVAITDSATSPLARLANESILVKTTTTSFFDSLTPAFLVTELLIALFAANARINVHSAVKKTEEQLWEVGEWWSLD